MSRAIINQWVEEKKKINLISQDNQLTSSKSQEKFLAEFCNELRPAEWFCSSSLCFPPILTVNHSSHADGWTCWLLWCKSPSSKTSTTACCKQGGHLNCSIQTDLRLLCPQFKLKGPCLVWSVTTLVWKYAQSNQSYPSVALWDSCWFKAGSCPASPNHRQTTVSLPGRGHVNTATVRWSPRELLFQFCFHITVFKPQGGIFPAFLMVLLQHWPSVEKLKMLYLKHPWRKSCVSDEPDFLNFLFAAQLSALDGSQGHFFGHICLPQLEARLLELEHKGL